MTRATADELKNSLSHLPGDVKTLLDQHRFSAEWLLGEAERSRNGTRSNIVQGEITAPTEEDVVSLPDPDTPQYREFQKIGEQALRRGECALAVLAGGMATRMGGVIKALVPATFDRTFLELRLQEQASLGETYGVVPPLWLMTSHATHQGIEEALGAALEKPTLHLFRQGLSVRLNEEGDVFRDEEGNVSLHAPGHGDFPDSLKATSFFKEFVQSGGKYLLVTNLDNLGGGLDPALIGMHIASDCAVTCEVVDKVGSDRGGIPARLDQRPVVLEEFRIPPTFDPQTVPVFNVNSFAFDASALMDLDMEWTYFEVKKKVGDRAAVQYERLINEVTFQLKTQYLRVPRTGAASRFLPIKDHDELARRQNELQELVRARGMIESEK